MNEAKSHLPSASRGTPAANRNERQEDEPYAVQALDVSDPGVPVDTSCTDFGGGQQCAYSMVCSASVPRQLVYVSGDSARGDLNNAASQCQYEIVPMEPTSLIYSFEKHGVTYFGTAALEKQQVANAANKALVCPGCVPQQGCTGPRPAFLQQPQTVVLSQPSMLPQQSFDAQSTQFVSTQPLQSFGISSSGPMYEMPIAGAVPQAAQPVLYSLSTPLPVASAFGQPENVPHGASSMLVAQPKNGLSEGPQYVLSHSAVISYPVSSASQNQSIVTQDTGWVYSNGVAVASGGPAGMRAIDDDARLTAAQAHCCEPSSYVQTYDSCNNALLRDRAVTVTQPLPPSYITIGPPNCCASAMMGSALPLTTRLSSPGPLQQPMGSLAQGASSIAMAPAASPRLAAGQQDLASRMGLISTPQSGVQSESAAVSVPQDPAAPSVERTQTLLGSMARPQTPRYTSTVVPQIVPPQGYEGRVLPLPPASLPQSLLPIVPQPAAFIVRPPAPVICRPLNKAPRARFPPPSRLQQRAPPPLVGSGSQMRPRLAVANTTRFVLSPVNLCGQNSHFLYQRRTLVSLTSTPPTTSGSDPRSHKRPTYLKYKGTEGGRHVDASPDRRE